MMQRPSIASLAVLAPLVIGACDQAPADRGGVDEIVANLVEAGNARDEIEVVEDQVVLAGDMLIGLESSREMAESDEQEFRHYRVRDELMIDTARYQRICVDLANVANDMQGPARIAIQNWNELALVFELAAADAGGTCDYTIEAKTTTGGNPGGGVYPSGGHPGPSLTVSTAASEGYPDRFAILTHAFMHELGHTLGFRHTDMFNYEVSCGGPAGQSEAIGCFGAVLVPGSPDRGTQNGSVMNRCQPTPDFAHPDWFTTSDCKAIRKIYGLSGTCPATRFPSCCP